MPGPDVAVNAPAPFHAAPITIPIEASSSSACTIATLLCLVTGSIRSRRQGPVKASASEEDGLYGTQPQTLAPRETAPKAAAELPSTKTRSPTLSERCNLSPIGHCRFISA